jgi:hypothetical protein
MKIIRLVTPAFISFMLPLCAVAQKKRAASVRPAAGSICIAVMPRPTSGEVSLSNPTGGNRNFNFSVQVDDLPVKEVSFDSGELIGGLSLGKSHLVKIRRDRELVQSFRFTFRKFSSRDLCLWFKPLYETWQLWEAKESTAARCECER